MAQCRQVCIKGAISSSEIDTCGPHESRQLWSDIAIHRTGGSVVARHAEGKYVDNGDVRVMQSFHNETHETSTAQADYLIVCYKRLFRLSQILLYSSENEMT
jgi:hypothetical protein